MSFINSTVQISAYSHHRCNFTLYMYNKYYGSFVNSQGCFNIQQKLDR